MTSARLMGNTIRIICTQNEIVDKEKMKGLYRASIRIISQNQELPIIIEAGQNVTFCKTARKLVRRLEPKWKNKTIVYIIGEL